MLPTIPEIRQRIYAMRNGIVADAMRTAGAPYRMIFGLNLPQLSEIARGIGQDVTLAEEMWATSDTRELVLLAPMVMPTESFTIDTARRWVASAPTAEAIDILCLKLLGRQPYIATLAAEWADSPTPLLRHASARLNDYL